MTVQNLEWCSQFQSMRLKSLLVDFLATPCPKLYKKSVYYFEMSISGKECDKNLILSQDFSI